MPAKSETLSIRETDQSLRSPYRSRLGHRARLQPDRPNEDSDGRQWVGAQCGAWKGGNVHLEVLSRMAVAVCVSPFKTRGQELPTSTWLLGRLHTGGGLGLGLRRKTPRRVRICSRPGEERA
jgi:hypothetical protein